MAASWDPEIVGKVFTVAARQTRHRGSHHVLGPNMDLAREARWGRTEETYGEDPYLTSRMMVAVVRAIQGAADYSNPVIDSDHVIATGKHFAGHGQPENGTNIGPVNLSERLLRETHFAPFEAAVKEAGLFSIMPAYHVIDGVPVHANRWMLDTVLRNEWGFRGTVVSDYYAVGEMASRHRVAADKADATGRGTTGLQSAEPDLRVPMQFSREAEVADRFEITLRDNKRTPRSLTLGIAFGPFRLTTEVAPDFDDRKPDGMPEFTMK